MGRIYIRLVLFFICVALLPIEAYAKRVRLTGQAITTISEDFTDKNVKVEHFLKDRASGRLKAVRFSNGRVPDWFRTEQDVNIDAEENEVGELLVFDGSSGTVTPVTDSPYNTDRRAIAVVRIHMLDGQSYLSAATVEQYMFTGSTNVRNYFYQTTMGKLTFNGDPGNDGSNDIFEAAINVNGAGTCDYNGWGSKADQILTSQGVSLSNYRHVLYILPSGATSSCGWSGIAYVTGSRSWVRGGSVGVIAHELGHNLGMHHASSDTNNDNVIDSEYGDSSCVMGGAPVRYLNAPHMDQMGVFSLFADKVATVGAGQFRLAALSLDPRYTQDRHILKVFRESTGEYYYLSYRPSQGMDAGIPSTYSRGLSIHRFSSSKSGKSSFVASLAPGEVFTDQANGIEIRADAIAADLQTIDISIRINAVCNPAIPTVRVSQSSISSTQASGSFTQTVTVTNNDSLACPVTELSFLANVPQGVQLNVPTTGLLIMPRETLSFTVGLSWSSLPNGTHSVQLVTRDQDGFEPHHQDVTTTMSLNINAPVPDTTAPTAVSQLKATLQKNGRIALSWSAASDIGSGVSHYIISRNGVQIATTTRLSFSDSGALVGTNAYEVRAVDRAGNIGAAATVSIVKSTSGPKGR